MCSISESKPVTNGELKLKLNGTAASQSELLQAPLPNPSLVVTADHNLKRVDAPVYAPKAGEVLLHVKATGICGYAARLLFLVFERKY
jgi:L-iditol 2-dehydrogenase